MIPNRGLKSGCRSMAGSNLIHRVFFLPSFQFIFLYVCVSMRIYCVFLSIFSDKESPESHHRHTTAGNRLTSFISIIDLFGFLNEDPIQAETIWHRFTVDDTQIQHFFFKGLFLKLKFYVHYYLFFIHSLNTRSLCALKKAICGRKTFEF